jgi:hypothetical protein
MLALCVLLIWMLCILLLTRNISAWPGGWISHAPLLNAAIHFCNYSLCDRGVVMWQEKDAVSFMTPNNRLLFDVFSAVSWILYRILNYVAIPLSSDQLFKTWNFWYLDVPLKWKQPVSAALPKLCSLNSGFPRDEMRNSARRVWRLVFRDCLSEDIESTFCNERFVEILLAYIA